MNDEGGEEYATEVGGGVLVEASCDATPLLETPEGVPPEMWTPIPMQRWPG